MVGTAADSADKLSYSAAVRQLAHAQKPGLGVPAYTRWVNRRMAKYVAALAYRWGLTPNMVSVISAAISAVGITVLVLIRPTWWSGVAAAVLFAFGYLLDSADGQVARLTGRSGPAGEWVDHVVDAIRIPAIHLAVMVGIFRSAGLPDWTLVLPILYCLQAVGLFMSQILAEQLSKFHGLAVTAPGTGRRQSFVLIPTDTGTFCWLFVAWGNPQLFLWLYAAMLVVNSAHAAISMRRKYKKLLQIGSPTAG
ncbi:CDP-alcohol phosphatidyltransferase family protein [Nakamurella antarctica]|uniref:CDP-alcohol phosphatidyltransferase family protein n=2 Tax=Nakamurella antarctica TaxID=1902245 RepID=A0A3G8ZQ36_9ACTN|nr:CDP-alcohol phosphatidyltransferase family protein [Nakamurella antarctica]